MKYPIRRALSGCLLAMVAAAFAHADGPATQPAAVFPPAVVRPPVVPSGAILLCGGGELPDAVWQRFIDLAGGVDAPIVFLPTAAPEPNDPNPKGLDRLKKLGARDVIVLPQTARNEVESAQVIDALKRAKGVWFNGGRQWRYVDAYAGTAVEPLFHDVLKRGGVIGGTSAGAAIQADLMVRGARKGNKEIFDDTYHTGFAFLPGTAIDIHLTERGRLEQLVDLVARYPQYLGIGLDEATAAEVRGSQLTVLGEARTIIVSRANGTDSQIELRQSDQFDLVQRARSR